jgi:hypothetical protein
MVIRGLLLAECGLRDIDGPCGSPEKAGSFATSPDDPVDMSDATSADPPYRVLHSLGGGGGTLVARVLSAIRGVVLLSGVNPRSVRLFNGALNPLEQVRRWHPSLISGLGGFLPEAIEKPDGFRRFLRALTANVAAAGKTLVVRDYNYVDFIGVPFLSPPPRNSSLLEALCAPSTMHSVFLVRHPADQLASLYAHDALNGHLSDALFVEGALAAASAFRNVPVVRYEDFTAAPTAALRLLCDAMALPYEPEALDTFQSVRSVTGDFRRIDEAVISVPRRSHAGADIRARLRSDPSYRRLCNLYGYDPAGP